MHCPWLPHERAPNPPFYVVFARTRLVCFSLAHVPGLARRGAIDIPPRPPA